MIIWMLTYIKSSKVLKIDSFILNKCWLYVFIKSTLKKVLNAREIALETNLVTNSEVK